MCNSRIISAILYIMIIGIILLGIFSSSKISNFFKSLQIFLDNKGENGLENKDFSFKLIRKKCATLESLSGIQNIHFKDNYFNPIDYISLQWFDEKFLLGLSVNWLLLQIYSWFIKIRPTKNSYPMSVCLSVCQVLEETWFSRPLI